MLNESSNFNFIDNKPLRVNLMKELNDKDFISSFVHELIEKGYNLKDISVSIEILEHVDSSYRWEEPRKVSIPKGEIGKFRDVLIFNDKDSLLLKAINKIFSERLGHLVSNQVYSYKRGVSVFKAAQEVKSSLTSSSINYIKSDISKYFNSVNVSTIFKSIDDLVEDNEGRELLRNLYSINCYKDDDGSINKEYLGLIPGTALSSFMSNYILKEIDKVLNDYVDLYVRYSDDIVMVDSDKWKLKTALGILNSSIKSFGLELNDDKVSLNFEVDNIEFLGLKITKDFIDVSGKNFMKIKSEIKSICKRVRRHYELDKKKKYYVEVDFYLKRAINLVNKFLYKPYFMEDGLHKNSKLTYIFRSITTDVSLKELDFYICDRLRYVSTGVNNSSNAKKVSTTYLEDLGFVSCVKLYNLSKVSADIFALKLHTILYKPLSFNNNYIPFDGDVVGVSKTNPITFLGFIESCDRLGCNLMLNGVVYDLERLEIDFINKEIRLGNSIIVKGNKVIIGNNLGAYRNGNLINFINIDGKLYNNIPSVNELVDRYRNTFLNDYDVKDKVKYNPYSYFTSVDNKRFYFSGFNKNLDLANPVLFALHFYCHLYEMSLKGNCKYREFITLGRDIPLVFESKLIP